MLEGSFSVAAFIISAAYLLSALSEDVRVVLDLAALAILLAGFFVVGRYKAALDATDKERDAQKERADREAAERKSLQDERVLLVAELAQEKARPDQSAVVALLGEMTMTLRDIHTAVVPRPTTTKER